MDHHGAAERERNTNFSSSLLEWALEQSSKSWETSTMATTIRASLSSATPTFSSVTSSFSDRPATLQPPLTGSVSLDALAIIISGMNSSTVTIGGPSSGAFDFVGSDIDDEIGGLSEGDYKHRTAYKFAVMVVLSVLTVATIVGNVFVIAAILLERALRTAGNYLVLSLALADLMVAALVMPLGAVVEIQQEWTLGSLLCDLWTSADVLCCTASILHLLAIALDRYWAVTNVDYIHRRTPARIGIMILAVWTAAAVVSIAPLFGWKDADFERRIQVEKRCLLSQDVGYQVFATISSFYGPLIFILLLYWKIFQVARKRIRHKPGGHKRTTVAITPAPSEVNAKLLDLKNERSLIGNRKRLLAPAKNKNTKSSFLSVEQNMKISKNIEISNDNRSSMQIDSDTGLSYATNNCDAINNATEAEQGQHFKSTIDAFTISDGKTTTITPPPMTMTMINNTRLPAGNNSVENNFMESKNNNNNNNNINGNGISNGNGATNGISMTHESANIATVAANNNNNNNNKNNNNVIVLDCSLLIDSLSSKGQPLTTSTIETVSMPGTTPNVRMYRKSRASSLASADLKPNHLGDQTQSSHKNHNHLQEEKSNNSNGSASHKSKNIVVALLKKSPTVSSLAVSGGSTRNGSHLENGSTTSGRLSSRAPRETLESKRERKAAKILAIITGIFVICWLPFFVNALLMPLCRTCEPSKIVFSIFLWLGYLNSLLNPIIYTIFSPDFRRGFRRILCGRSSVG